MQKKWKLFALILAEHLPVCSTALLFRPYRHQTSTKLNWIKQHRVTNKGLLCIFRSIFVSNFFKLVSSSTNGNVVIHTSCIPNLKLSLRFPKLKKLPKRLNFYYRLLRLFVTRQKVVILISIPFYKFNFTLKIHEYY